jgi:Na+/melibiose symporter-like transporter
LLLLFYYNQVLGVSGTLCGIALFIAIAIDAVTDSLMGSLSDSWRSRWGRRHPFMYAAAIPMALAFVQSSTLLPFLNSDCFLSRKPRVRLWVSLSVASC